MDNKSNDIARLISRLEKHGAKNLDENSFFAEAQVSWNIRIGEEISEICFCSGEFMSSAIRSCKMALEVVDLIDRLENDKDEHLLTALKKYVEDTGEALTQIDNTLGKGDSSLATLLFEIPNKRSPDEMSWRNLIARRIVIAHKLLTVDSEKVYHEAKRDFGKLDKLLSRVHFAPVKTNVITGSGFSPLIKTDVVKNLIPYEAGRAPRVGECLILICEDKVEGLLCFRLARAQDGNIVLIGPRGIKFSVHGIGIKTD